MAKWKLILLRSAGFGAGFAITVAVIISVVVWYTNRPKPEPAWNDKAFKATYHELALRADERVNVQFSYVVENKTDFDYTLDPSGDISIMTVLPDNKGLGSNEEVTLDKAAFIPAKQKVTITLDKPYDYNSSFTKADRENLDKLTAFMNRRLKETTGFVLFDKRNRYMLKLPSGWEASNATGPLKAPPQP